MKEHYDRGVFFDAVRDAPFDGKLFQENVDGMNRLLDVWEASPFKDRRCLAYILGTDRHETGTMMPREEIGKGKGRSYGTPDPVTGQIYYGRGDVQLTWKENYAKATKQINERNLVGRQVDLVKHPEQALEPDISAVILIYGMEEGWFTGKKTGDFFNDTTSDWVNARKVVNGLDRAHLVAGYAHAFYSALGKAATVAEPEQPEHPDEPDENPTLALLVEQIKAVTGAKEVILTI